MMKEKIKKHLQEIEEEGDIKILLACETGSRAWGFPSPDSDYDVRMVYVHKQDWYLSLTESKDSIERMLDDNEIDISGWDLRKSLRLLKKSNVALLERIQSPIIYMADEMFVSQINELAKDCFSPIATLYHYLNMAKKTMEEISVKKEYKLKKLFYALRAVTACKWVMDKNEIPPIVFMQMVDNLAIDSKMKTRVNELIEFKSTKNESYLHSGEELIFTFIEEQINRAELNAKQLSSNKVDTIKMDDFFRKAVLNLS